MSIKEITKLLQTELNRLGAYPRLTVDGDPGPKTLKALSAQLESDKNKPSPAPAPTPVDGEALPVYWKAHPFHPMFKVAEGYTHLHPYDILKSITGEKEIYGSKDNELIAHMHEHSGNLGLHSDGSDYSDEVPHCASAWNWACDGGGCEKSNNALASSWETMGEKFGAHKFKKGDKIPRGALINLNGHITSADEEFTWTGKGSFSGFGSNQANSVKTSSYPQSRIRTIHLVKPKAGTKLAPIGTKPTPATGSEDESTR